MPSWVKPVLARINVLAQGHNAVMPVRLEPAALQSRVKYSTTEPLSTQFQSYSNIKKTHEFYDLNMDLVSSANAFNQLYAYAFRQEYAYMRILTSVGTFSSSCVFKR